MRTPQPRFKQKSFLILIPALIIPAIVFGSSGSGQITGLVYDADTGEPIPGANVLLQNRFAGAASDQDGKFTLKNLSQGTYSLQISGIGYETLRLDSVVVADNPSPELTVKLIPKALLLKSVTVTPGKFSIMGSEAVATQTLTQREIRTMPQLGDDFFRAVTRLPGMSGNDFSTRFTVRGGEYEEVLLTLDGLQLYEPFHLKDIDGGAMSIVDVAAVESIDLMTGGFPAVYGDKMSAAFNIKSRQVPPDQNRFSAGISFINARAFAEGTFDGNRGSWLISARRGYIDYVLQMSGADDNISPTYYDIFAKLHYQLGDKHSVAAHVLHAYDDLRFIDEEEGSDDSLLTNYGNSYAWITLLSQFHPKVFAQTVASVGKIDHNRFGYECDGVIPKLIAHDKEDFQFIGFKSDWEYEPADFMVLKFGSEIQSREATYDYMSQDFLYDYVTTPDSSYVQLKGIDTVAAPLEKSGNKFAGYLAGRFRISEPLVTEIGLRYDHNSYTDDEDISPRLNLAYNFNDKTTLCVGWGRYYQSQGIDEISVGDGEVDSYPSQRADLLVAGLGHELESGARFRVEVYNKSYRDLRPAYRNTFDDIEAFPEREDDRTLVFRKEGTSRGIELYLKKDTGGKLSWWSSYAYAKSEEDVDHIYFPGDDASAFYDITIPTPQDQRHTLYFDLHYRPTTRWQISTAFQLHSGWPYTDVYLASRITPEGTIYWVQSGTQWGARHKTFHRLDVRVNRYFPLKKGRITVFVEMLNVLGRKNVRGYSYHLRHTNDSYYIERTPEHWFGRLPSLGISYDINF